ncbi:hypothetical protein F5984_10135 [Rudanella paleaurantiibacter]|uniref:NAD(+)--protein-arginine ADP-ribosyltransferase n=1 Tax=Rudanella paleaurantiibacter TaxID=2614655 RepID=A0A7J5U0K4_9BACT|nr:ADP-ribosyltransferase domain-containing protein [Rudanella paleaurantiibacter]KAB7731157.1 hypothetical protein F5984_10135 [Rudanella paleaurantiibacter]
MAYLTLSKSLCNTVVQTYQCGTTPATPISSIDTTPLTNLAPGDTIRTGDFDVVVTEVIGGGASGWIGKGYTEIPYLKNQRIAVELNSAVVNDCYELVSGTVVSAYDPAWGGVRSVDMAIDQIRDLATRLVDLYNTYTGTAEQQAQIRQANAQLCENITSNNELSADQKATLLAKCQAYQADAETFLTCTAPAPTTSGVGNRNTARSATSASCTVTADMLTGQVNDIQQAASANATATPPKSKPNEYFSATGELLKPLVFFAVGDKKVVDLPKGAKLDIRMIDQSIFDRNANRLMSFQEVTKKYYADPLKSSSDAIQYIAEGDKTLYPLRAFSTALPEVFTVTYRIDPQGGCKAEVFKTKLTAEGQIDGPKASVWVATSDCGQTDEFLAKYGQGLKTILAANNQRADVYLYDCAKPNKYVHVTATQSETLTGSATTDRPGEANILVRACWNSTTKNWATVKTEFRVQPAENAKWSAKRVTAAKINDAFDRKAKELLAQRSTETSPGEGTNTNYSSLLTDPAEGKFEYKNSNIFAFIVGLKDISGKLIELAKVPESTWNPQAPGYTESVVKVPAVLAGGTDQTIEEFTDGLQFVDLALDIAAEPAKAKQIWDGIRQIRPETVKNIIREHVATYTAGGPKAFYQGGRDGITIAFMWKGLASLVAKAATGVEQAGATVVALMAGGADDIVAMLLRLQKKFKALNRGGLFDQFKKDFENKPDLLQQFDTDVLDIKAYDALATSSYRTNATYLRFFGNQTVRDNLKRVISDESLDFKNLTFEHVTAIYHYTTPAFRELNSALRNPALMNDYLRSFQTVLNDAIDKLPKRIGTTFRGTSLPPFVIDQYELAYRNGTSNLEKAFTSSSKDPIVAQRFADQAVKDGEIRVVFTVNGRSGVDMSGMSAAVKYQESEVLFKSTSPFKVTDFKLSSDAKGSIYLIELTE